MVSGAASLGRDTSLVALQRAVRAALPTARTQVHGTALELASFPDPQRLSSPQLLEGSSLRRQEIGVPPTVAFAAFQDGTQRSAELAYLDGVPIVCGTAGAVVRIRIDRRLHTWRHVIHRALYVPRNLITDAQWSALEACGASLVDTTAGAQPSAHPRALREAAVQAVRVDRERLERTLTEAWATEQREPLLVDGGISGSTQSAHASQVVGVVKSHATLFADPASLGAVLDLGAGQRTNAFLVAPRNRSAVASWYLRLHDPAGRDPLWGPVRVEMAHDEGRSESAVRSRADDVSSWILAEGNPTAHPDPRWDTIVYGVRDCEVFLKAVQ